MTKERKRLVKNLDTLSRKILLIRDRRPGDMFRCISCRRLLPLNVAQVTHYISRRYESVRWNLNNIHLGCPHCNNWLAGNPIEYRKSLIEKYGEDEVNHLESIYRVPPKYTEFDLGLLVKEYQGILKGYKTEEQA